MKIKKSTAIMLKAVLFKALSSDNGVDIIKILKRAISIIKTLLVIGIKNFVGHAFYGAVDFTESLVIIFAVIIFRFFLHHIVVCGNNFGGFISRVGITFLLKVMHNLSGRLIKAFICQNISLQNIIAVDNHGKPIFSFKYVQIYNTNHCKKQEYFAFDVFKEECLHKNSGRFLCICR